MTPGHGVAWWAAHQGDALLAPLFARQIAAWSSVTGGRAARWDLEAAVPGGAWVLLVGHGHADGVDLGELGVVSTAQLAARLGGASLVVVSACGAGAAVAPALRDAGVAAVVAPSAPVHARDALGFLQAFAAALAAGDDVDDALAAGRAALGARPPDVADAWCVWRGGALVSGAAATGSSTRS